MEREREREREGRGERWRGRKGRGEQQRLRERGQSYEKMERDTVEMRDREERVGSDISSRDRGEGKDSGAIDVYRKGD